MEFKDYEDLEFYEKMIFNWEKENVYSCEDLRRRYKQFNDLVDFTKIYRCIINWRIKKWGSSSITMGLGRRSKEKFMYEVTLENNKKKRRLKNGKSNK